MRRLSFLLGFVALTVVSANATTYDLYDLINNKPDIDNGGATDNGSFQVGNLEFTFTLATLNTIGFTSPVGPLAQGQFDITTDPESGSDGFAITTAGASALAFIIGANSLDLSLSYNVTTVPPGQTIISDLEGSTNGTCATVGLASCSLTVNENAFALGTTNPSILSDGGFTYGVSAPVNNYSLSAGSTILPPVSSMKVTKDISLQADALFGLSDAEFSIVTQLVSETVPEPGLYGALALGFCGLFWFVRKRRMA
jgi:hypothetical protein